MDNLINMVNEIKTLLTEAKMKNIFKFIDVGDIILIHFKGDIKIFGSFQRFEVFGKNENGIIVIAEVNNKKYSIDKNKITPRQIWIGDEETGEKYIVPITDMSFKINNLNGEVIKLDDKDENLKEPIDVRGKNVSDEDNEDAEQGKYLNQKLIKFNEIIKSLKVDDNLQIKTALPNNDDDEYSETILTFSCNDIEEDNIELNLTWAEGDKASGYRDKLNDSEILIKPNNLIRIENDYLVLNLFLRNKFGSTSEFPLKYIFEMGIDVIHGNKETMNKKALSKIIRNDPTILKLFNTQPNIMDTLMGASPTGVYQLGKLLQKYKVNNSYLTKDKHVSFRLLSKSIGNPKKHKNYLINSKKRKEPYDGIMIDDTTIKYGKISQNHLRLKLIKDLNDGIYDVKITSYNPSGDESNYGIGKIQLTDIEN